MTAKAHCYGTFEHPVHVAGCTEGHPCCATRRRTSGQVVCDCPAYRFPHRATSGRCNPEQRNAAAWGPALAA